MRSSITIFLTILCIAIMPANAENGSLKVGDKIPEFLGIDTDGDIVLTTEHHGKILVVRLQRNHQPIFRLFKSYIYYYWFDYVDHRQTAESIDI